MKIYTFYTDSHDILLNKYFLPTVPDEFEVIVEKFPQDCESGNFMQSGWFDTMTKKVNYVLKSIEECWGGEFIHADCDVQFFKPFKKDILSQLDDCDVAAQQDEKNELCCGFFICKANKRTKNLFEEVKRLMSNKTNDQVVLNSIKNNYVKSKTLDHRYFSVVQYLQKEYIPLWTPEIKIDIFDKNIIMHHANWTIGVENKIKLLDTVRLGVCS